jgi:hypothetical protein
VVILDQERWIDSQKLVDQGTAIEVDSCYGLRRAWEQEGRRRVPSQGLLFILVRDSALAEPRDLPFDIEQQAEIVSLRLPIADDFKPLVRALPDTRGDRLVSALLTPSPDPLGATLAAGWGISFQPDGATPATELQATLRLRSDPATPAAIWDLLRPRLRYPLSKALADDPPDTGPLQAAWEDWCRNGRESPWRELIESTGSSLAPLFALGLLRTVPGHRDDLPEWALVGTRSQTPYERASVLLESAPAAWPSDLSSWTEVARWWGELRAALAEGTPAMDGMADRAWCWWNEADVVFRQWLSSSMGGLMMSASPWPATVARIAPFLARRVREGVARRILLMVVDGMGMAQWSLVSREAGLRSIVSGGCVAMVPTLTSVSRQAIFAGSLPQAFAETLLTTNAEERRWAALWRRETEGLLRAPAGYWRLVGRSPDEVPDLSRVDIAGVVVNAADEMMHGAEVLGDSQFAASLQTWVRHGFLRSLAQHAAEKGFEIWVTADHGNIEALPAGLPKREGLAIESAGLRVRLYADPGLRSQSGAEGVMWDPPGLPIDAIFPVFASGRGGYFNSGRRVAHGGFSLDEVIVPLARVEP